MTIGPVLYMVLSVLPAVLLLAWVVWISVAVSDIRAELRTIRRTLGDRVEQ